MSLKSIDISKINKPSLRGLKFSDPTPVEARATPTKIVARPPTPEEMSYNRMVSKKPLLEDLVKVLDLVEIKKMELIKLAQEVIEEENNYSKEEIVQRIKEATEVTTERAESGLELMLHAGVIEIALGGRYYLADSTPF